MDKKLLPLSSLSVGESGIVKNLLSSGIERRRMLDLGIVANTNIEVILRSHSGDPMAYFIRGAVIALRNEDAKKILVHKNN